MNLVPSLQYKIFRIEVGHAGVDIYPPQIFLIEGYQQVSCKIYDARQITLLSASRLPRAYCVGANGRGRLSSGAGIYRLEMKSHFQRSVKAGQMISVHNIKPCGSAARAACRMGTCKNSYIQIVVEDSTRTEQAAGKWKPNEHWIGVWTLF